MNISILSSEFGGLMLDLEMNNDGAIKNAYFAANGHEIPFNMWIRLNKNTKDCIMAAEEMERELEHA